MQFNVEKLNGGMAGVCGSQMAKTGVLNTFDVSDVVLFTGMRKLVKLVKLLSELVSELVSYSQSQLASHLDS